MDDPDVIHKHLAKFKQAPHTPTQDEITVRITITSPSGEPEERRFVYYVPSDKYETFIQEIDEFFQSKWEL